MLLQSIAPQTLQPVHIMHSFATPVERVFDAWVTPQMMRRWLFAGDANEILDVRADARPGGSFSILERNQGTHVEHYGRYHIVEGPARLGFTLRVPKHFSGETYCMTVLSPTSSGTLMTFSQSGVDRNVVDQNWRDMFDILGAVLGT